MNRRLVAASAAALAMLAAPAARAVDPPPTGRERVEAIEIDGEGRRGAIQTSPVYMAGTGGVYRFGEGACRANTLAPSTLEALHRSMRTRQSVRIHAATAHASDGTEVRCVQRITFFAPAP